MKVNWNLLEELLNMQKNYHLDAYAVDAVDQRSRPVRFEITDGCNGKYCIRTEHDEVYVDKRQLTDVQLLIAEESAR